MAHIGSVSFIQHGIAVIILENFEQTKKNTLKSITFGAGKRQRNVSLRVHPGRSVTTILYDHVSIGRKSHVLNNGMKLIE